jgi:protein gp37
MKPEWVREVRDQCEDNGVAFFFKQWGGFGRNCMRSLASGDRGTAKTSLNAQAKFGP